MLPLSGNRSPPPAPWPACGSLPDTTPDKPGPSFKKSVENAINPKLEILASSVAAVEARLGRVEGRLGQVEVDVGALKADVAFIRGRQEERDKTAAPSAS